MGQVVVRCGHLPPRTYEAWTVEEVDAHLGKVDQRRKYLAEHPTTNAINEYGQLTAAVDGLLELRLEFTGSADAAGT